MFFTGLPNVYGTYDLVTGRARQVKQPVTDQVILAHLQGKQPYGVYLLVDDRTRAVVVDFDQDDPQPPQQFVGQANHYGIKAYIERSKSKGWHAWVFLELPGVLAAKARLVIKSILDDIDQPSTEVFPKQDRLTSDTCYGNFINAPLFGSLVPQARTVFVDPNHGLKPYPDQWSVLENVRLVPESLLDEIIEINELAQLRGPLPGPDHSIQSNSIGTYFGLPPCTHRMLTEGVTEYQRVVCFRLALHLKKAGIPEDVAIAGLSSWAAKNRPLAGKRAITKAEIVEQTACAYANSYRSCGCEEPVIAQYCHSDCPLYRRRHSLHAQTQASEPMNKRSSDRMREEP